MTEQQEPESAASKVCRIPHLLQDILEYIGCQPSKDPTRNITLLNCMLVNSIWEDEAVRVYWKETYSGGGHLPLPTLERLLNVGAERRQRCANHIHRLDIILLGRNLSRHRTEPQETFDSADVDSDYEGSSLVDIGQLSFPRL